MEDIFSGAGTTPGIHVWKIENLNLVKLKEHEQGEFYNDKCYIVLNTAPASNSPSSFKWSVHFWFGKDASSTDKEFATINARKLGELLNAPLEYRECQGHESPTFCSFFTKGLRYVDGHTDATTRLYQVKGKRNVRITKLDTPCVGAMNKGDCFILCTPTKIWIYFGKYSKSCEKYKAIHAANDMQHQDYAEASPEIEIEQVKQNSEQSVVQAFFTALGGGSREEVADPPAEDDDDDVDVQKKKATVSLYRVSDSSGEMKVDKIGEDNLSKDMLNPSDCFILDPSGVPDIFVWIGNICAQQEKDEAFANAEKFLKAKGYPEWANIQRIMSGGETSTFKQYFRVWPADLIQPLPPPLGQRAGSGQVSPKRAAKLLKNMGTCIGFCPDDGLGKAELWRVEDFELVPVPRSTYGIFYGGDSYVLLYTYDDEDGEEKYIIYYWQGKESTPDEIGASAMHAVKLDEKLLLRAILVRLFQGEESTHFLRIFKGAMVVFLGGHASGFRKIGDRNEADWNTTSKTRLFHVRGTCEFDTRAVQIQVNCSSLDSDDVFILDCEEQEKQSYVWIGTGASEKEKKTATSICALIRPGVIMTDILEGEEPLDFWDLLGGKKPYNDALTKMTMTRPQLHNGARLFHCYIPVGRTKLVVEEVSNFRQEDLEEDDVMVLDSGGDEVLIWIGKGATPEEKMYSHKLADDYIATNYMRSGGICVSVPIIVKQHHEPDVFKKHFPVWDNKYWNN